MTELGDLLTPATRDVDAASAVITPDFLQGRTAFGGVVAALCARAMTGVLETPRPLRSLTISLVAPVRPGEVAVDAVSLRQGKAASHVHASLLQEGSCCAVALGAFGSARQSSLVVAPTPVPSVPQPDALEVAPFISGLTPEFSKFFEYRWPRDAMPFSGQGTGSTQGWLRLREPLAATEPFLVALADAWPSPALPMLRSPETFSTLSWSLELTGAPVAQSADAWWTACAEVEQASDGYVRQRARYWDATGHLVAVSHQVVTVFERNGGS